ncbi:TPA: site-specific DNA-methyltransferase [Yersinia enterocolitica]|nr:site-specific DNA-methyltransferase [Yersinia enterocolitica]HDW8049941.1 site-specific DNA-methyltransferase [Yersinia enterocolitica]HEB0976178.1 site-specific DNA-methyltransferase [Yersinia enterocolitica]
MSKTKLELTWIGKNEKKKLEPRILLEEPSKSYHATQKVNEEDLFDNKLIFGDNLLALKALEQEYAGKVKCIFIDPPYNTGSAFEHYDDGVEHSIWLTLMRDRLEVLRNLLSEDGSLWITIDDNEAHYLKVMCDEIFGRINFIANAIWEKSDSPRMDANYFSSRHDHILIYAKNINSVTIRKQKTSLSDLPKHYNKVDDEGKPYYLKPLRAMGQADRREDRPSMYYPIIAPDGQEVYPKKQDGSDGRWRWASKKVEEEQWRIEWTKTKGSWSPNFRVYAENSEGRPPETIWFNTEVGSNRTSKAEIKKVIENVTAFDTPKPEALIKKILEISTDKNDLVLDSFAGSGTTGAVAHKMGRHWIMVELGEHCHTHIIPRLQKVIDGDDEGGISSAVNWQGGGGFRYYKLAPSLIVKDKFGLEVINKDYNPEMLAEAVCKLEGFSYAPSEMNWWNHGYSTETDHIYVTTQSLSIDKLEAISEEVGSDRTLLVMCGAFRCDACRFANLTLKKLPKSILEKCEWGRDNYSLNLENFAEDIQGLNKVSSEQNELF